MSSKKVITIAITTAALTLGGFGIASASGAKATKTTKVAVTKVIKAPSGMNMMGRDGGFDAELSTVLSGLVTKGTLTQAQVDAIKAALTAAHAANKPPVNADRAAVETLVATTLGIDVTTLETRLAAGDSLATIAGTKTAALITALVAFETQKIDAAVTAGTLTAAQATTLKTNLTAHVTAEVNGVRGIGAPDGKGGPGGKGGHGGGMGGHMGDADGDMGPMMGAPTIPSATS